MTRRSLSQRHSNDTLNYSKYKCISGGGRGCCFVSIAALVGYTRHRSPVGLRRPLCRVDRPSRSVCYASTTATKQLHESIRMAPVPTYRAHIVPRCPSVAQGRRRPRRRWGAHTAPRGRWGPIHRRGTISRRGVPSLRCPRRSLADAGASRSRANRSTPRRRDGFIPVWCGIGAGDVPASRIPYARSAGRC